MKKAQSVKKAIKFAATILLYAFIVVCLFSVIMTISAKKDEDGDVTIFGMQMRYVLTGSMEACEYTDVSKYDIKDIPQGSMIFVETVPEDPDEAAEWYSDLDIGDVLTFRYQYSKADRQIVITHRITGIGPSPNGQGYIIRLQGDNRNSPDGALEQTIDTSEPLSPNHVIGKVVGQNKLLGSLIGTLKKPVGIVFIVIVPALIIMVHEILKVAKILNEDKVKKEHEENERRNNELEELKRRLAELEGAKASSPDNKSDEES